MPYALLQKNLAQTIDRQTLEEASIYAPHVARADCARLHRELFGIVVTHLPHDDAVALQVALDHFGFPTDLVPQEDLPRLTAPKFRRGIRFHPEGFTALDGLGREDIYPWRDVQFAAGGFVSTVVHKTESELQWHYSARGSRQARVKRTEKVTDEKEFRLDLFLSREPYRLQFKAGKETLFRFDDLTLRVQQEEEFGEILRRVAGVLPADCLGQGVHAATHHQTFVYPSVSAFDEEITWHLYQRLQP